MKTDRILQEEIECWLAECTRVLPSEEEPLVRWYVVRRKPYVEITNFRQRIRKDSPGSRFPGPSEANEEMSESDPQSSDRGARRKSAFAHASSSYQSTPPFSEEGGAGGNQNSHAKTALDFNACEAFDQLAADYPQAGRLRLGKAFEHFEAALRAEWRTCKSPPGQACAAMRTGLERWLRSELWQAGKVHWIGKWVVERLWAEEPLPAQIAPQPRAGPVSKREQGMVDFSRRLIKEMQEEKNEDAGHVHCAGSG